MGFIAQEVEEIYPDVVNSTGKRGMKSVNYTALIAPAVEAIKSLHDKIVSLKAENEQLKTENAAIKSYLCNKDPRAPFCKTE